MEGHANSCKGCKTKTASTCTETREHSRKECKIEPSNKSNLNSKEGVLVLILYYLFGRSQLIHNSSPKEVEKKCGEKEEETLT